MLSKIMDLIKNSDNFPRANLVKIVGNITQTAADVAQAFCDAAKDEIAFEKRVKKRMNKSYEDYD